MREWTLRRKSRPSGQAPAGAEPDHIALQAALAAQQVCVRGTKFRVGNSPRDFSGFWQRVTSGSWEPETFALIDRFAAPGTRFVDIGAWIGPTALYAAARGAQVDAYECDPVALDCLDANLALNPALRPRVAITRHGLGEADTDMRLWSVELGNSETSVFARHERDGAVRDCSEAITVGLRDAAAVFRQAGYAAEPTTLIKIDVEGAEFRIVPRLREIIAGSVAIWYVSFHELNINPPHVRAHAARIAEMLRTLLSFAELRWYDARLQELDKDAVLDAIIERRWAPQGSLVFSAQALAA